MKRIRAVSLRGSRRIFEDERKIPTIYYWTGSLWAEPEYSSLRETREGKLAIDWFRSNKMVVNPDKFQVMFLGIENSRTILIDNHTITSSETVKLLGITIDRKLTFQPHY